MSPYLLTAQQWAELQARRARDERIARLAVYALAILLPFLYFYL